MKRHGKQRILCLANKYMKNKNNESSVMKRKKFTKKNTEKKERNKRDLIKQDKNHKDDYSDWKRLKRMLEMM